MARSKLSKLIVGLLIMTSTLSAHASTGKFQITVTGLRSGNGKLAVSVFSINSASGFPGNADKASETFYVDLNGKNTATLVSKGLPFGDYAVALMHDEDGDGKFGTTLFGIPKEGFGFSNNPRVLFGAPDFKSCTVTLAQEQLEVPIQVKYIL